MSWQLDANYLEGSYDNAENDLENDSRTVFNTKVTYRFNDTLALNLIGRNLSDKDYITRGNITRSDVVNVSQPRTFALQIEGSW